MIAFETIIIPPSTRSIFQPARGRSCRVVQINASAPVRVSGEGVAVYTHPGTAGFELVDLLAPAGLRLDNNNVIPITVTVQYVPLESIPPPAHFQ